MKINVSKENEDIILSLIINDKPETFDYEKLINEIYNKKEIKEIIYSDDVNEWERAQINKMIDKIKNIVKNPEE